MYSLFLTIQCNSISCGCVIRENMMLFWVIVFDKFLWLSKESSSFIDKLSRTLPTSNQLMMQSTLAFLFNCSSSPLCSTLGSHDFFSFMKRPIWLNSALFWLINLLLLMLLIDILLLLTFLSRFLSLFLQYFMRIVSKSKT